MTDLAILYLFMYGSLVRAGYGLFAALTITNHLIAGCVLYVARRYR